MWHYRIFKVINKKTKKGLIQCLKWMLKDALHYKTKIEYLNNEEYEKIFNKSF